MRLRPNLAALAALALGLTTMAGGLPARADGDPAAGKKVFNKCRACHTLEEGKNRVGARLGELRQFGRVRLALRWNIGAAQLIIDRNLNIAIQAIKG